MMVSRVRALQQAVPGVHEERGRRLGMIAPVGRLLPGGGLRRGSTVAVTAPSGGGAMSLALALAAAPTRSDLWVAVLGLPELGLVAAHELGVDLGHLVVVTEPAREQWSSVLGALVDGFDMVLAEQQPMPPGEERRLTGRLRERGTVLVQVSPPSQHTRPSPRLTGDVVIRASAPRWEGLDGGYGRLSARRVSVTVSGRGEASQPRHGDLWLPGPDGAIAVAEPVVVVERTPGRTATAAGSPPVLVPVDGGA